MVPGSSIFNGAKSRSKLNAPESEELKLDESHNAFKNKWTVFDCTDKENNLKLTRASVGLQGSALSKATRGTEQKLRREIQKVASCKTSHRFES